MSDNCSFEAATLMVEDLPGVNDDILSPDDLEEYLSSKLPDASDDFKTNQTTNSSVNVTHDRESGVGVSKECPSRDVPTHPIDVSPGFDVAECRVEEPVEPPRHRIFDQNEMILDLCRSAVTINTSADYSDTELPIYIKANIVGKLELNAVEALGYTVFHKVTKAIFGKAVGGTDRDARLRYIKRMTAALFTACKKTGFDQQMCPKKLFGEASIRDDMKEYFREHFDMSESNRMDVPEKLAFWARNDQLKQCSKGVVRRMDKEWKALPTTAKDVIQRNANTPNVESTIQLVQINDTCLADFIQATGDKKTRSKFSSNKGYAINPNVAFSETQYDPSLKDRYMKKWDAFIAASPDKLIMECKSHFRDMFQRWYDRQYAPTERDGPSHLRGAFLRLQEECFVKNANAFGNNLFTLYFERYGRSKSSRIAKRLISKATDQDRFGTLDQWTLQPKTQQTMDSDSDAGAAA